MVTADQGSVKVAELEGELQRQRLVLTTKKLMALHMKCMASMAMAIEMKKMMMSRCVDGPQKRKKFPDFCMV